MQYPSEINAEERERTEVALRRRTPLSDERQSCRQMMAAALISSIRLFTVGGTYMPAISQPTLFPLTSQQSNPVTAPLDLNRLTTTALAQIHQSNRDNVELLHELENLLQPRRRNNATQLLALVRNDLAQFRRPTEQLPLDLNCADPTKPRTHNAHAEEGVSTARTNTWLGRLSIAAIVTAIIGGIAQGLGTQLWELCWPAAKYLLGN